jgi:hypothetical protein
MHRHIITFQNLHQVLRAEKALKGATGEEFNVRPAPTPPGLGSAICGMSIEILDSGQVERVVDFLTRADLPPQGVHLV